MGPNATRAIALLAAALSGCPADEFGPCGSSPGSALLSPPRAGEAPRNAVLWIMECHAISCQSNLEVRLRLVGPGGEVALEEMPGVPLPGRGFRFPIARRKPAGLFAPGAHRLDRLLRFTTGESSTELVGEFTVGGKVDQAPPSKTEIRGVEFLSGGDPCLGGDLITLDLSPATDDVTSPGRLLHEVYVAGAAGRQDLTLPSFILLADERMFNDNGSVVFPGEENFVKVRAVDEAGNPGPFGEEWRVSTPHEHSVEGAIREKPLGAVR